MECILVCGQNVKANEIAKRYCRLSGVIFKTEESPDDTVDKPRLSWWKDFNNLEVVAVGHDAIRKWLSKGTPLQTYLDAEIERLNQPSIDRGKFIPARHSGQFVTASP